MLDDAQSHAARNVALQFSPAGRAQREHINIVLGEVFADYRGWLPPFENCSRHGIPPRLRRVTPSRWPLRPSHASDRGMPGRGNPL